MPVLGLYKGAIGCSSRIGQRGEVCSSNVGEVRLIQPARLHRLGHCVQMRRHRAQKRDDECDYDDYDDCDYYYDECFYGYDYCGYYDCSCYDVAQLR